MGLKTSEDAVLEKEEIKAEPPPFFKVLLLNDDYTPMEFVIAVLEHVFGMTRELSTQVMLKVHHEGRGVCGVFPKDIATTKVEQVKLLAQRNQHPLQCVMEKN